MRKQLFFFYVGFFVLGACDKPTAQISIETKPVPVSEPPPTVASKKEPTKEQPGAALVGIPEEPIDGDTDGFIGGVVGESILPGIEPQEADACPPLPKPGGLIPPKKIAEKCPLPVYPEAAKATGMSGSVKLRVAVSREGRTSSIEVLDVVGSAAFEAPAKKFLEDCQFTPAMFNGKAIAVTKLEVVKFTLE